MMEDPGNPLVQMRNTIALLQQELIVANNEFIALTLELEERMDQLRKRTKQLAREIVERRRMESALLASEQRFRTLVENSADGIALVDRTGICTYVVPSVERLLGYTATELVGRNIFHRTHPLDLPNLRQCFSACLEHSGTETSFAIRVRASNGVWRYLEGIGRNCLEDPPLQAIVVNFRDVTERRRVEQQIRNLNRNLERQVRARTAQLQLAYEFEASLKRIADKVRDSLDEAQILQTVVRELSLAIPGCSCNAALYDTNRKTSTICYEYTRFSCSYKGRSLNMSAYPELYQQLLQGETFQLCSLTPNTERGRVAVLAQPIFDDRGVLGDLWLVNQPHYGFSDQDVRLVQQVANQSAIALRQSHLYQAAQAQVKELERLNRLKDDFLSTVSHELRAPMTNIKLSAQMLAIQLRSLAIDPQNPVNRYIQILQNECNREIALIEDLLDLARLDATSTPLEVAPINLQQHLAELTASFQERACNQQQRLILDIPASLPALNSHADYFNRVVTELLHNACKYTPPHEQIIVSAWAVVEETPKRGRRQRRTASAPGRLLVRVTNTGVEIPAEERDRIFDKFYRIPDNDPWRHGGTGLGLALVKKLTERLGCNIQVDSENRQTSFTLTFPPTAIASSELSVDS